MSHGAAPDTHGVNTTLLPLTDPLCNSNACLAFWAARNASQAATPWAGQFEYGHWLSYTYIVMIGIAAAIYILQLWTNKTTFRPTTAARPSLVQRFVALKRYIFYRRIPGSLARRLLIPSMGMLAFLVLSWVIVIAMSFAERPYYRGRRGFGSPPLAIRTGLMATALTPIIVALAGKVNLVTALTGISHEKLNIIHRWVALMILVLSIIHTVPFLVAPLREGGAAALKQKFYADGSYEYTGTPPLGILVGLCVLSIPYIRKRWYNAFYRLHIPFYICYLGLLFWHAADQIDSWSYLWATLAIWLATTAYRIFYKNQITNVTRKWMEGFDAHITALPGDMARVDVYTPSDFTWTAGQHCFLRVPAISWLESHPFTIASLPSRTTTGKTESVNVMTFYTRNAGGFTKLLAAAGHGVSEVAATAFIDGPYGGVVEALPTRYDCLIFVAGGGGISACIPWITLAARYIHVGRSSVKSIKLVWAAKQPDHFSWISAELREAKALLPEGMLELHLFASQAAPASGSDSDEVQGKNGLSDVAPVHCEGRPVLQDIIPPMVTGSRNMILACGPDSLRVDVSNVAAALQSKVLGGEAEKISLHTETFGW
ncbi:ferric/cupric reductase transmembrane component-like protein 1 [Elsinoe australis]|uniref:ferric-chelate reductase (NADPH) n=1 Tax=Elsinoe australis TaxID=40998 RepID=A0A4U7BAN1_9PEZI|nr:ferric/cupric reductase transmembrane component-like protein 1 [Elsinoe australis]